MTNRYALLAHARGWLGYQALPGRVTPFTGNGLPWDGAFLQTVATDVKFNTVSLTNTVSALAFYTKNNRVVSRPKPGDLVFFAFSQDANGQPHVGLVCDTREFAVSRKFRVIEGMVSSGQPKANTENNGVHERGRYYSDVLAFVRPVSERRGKAQSGPLIYVSHLTTGKQSDAIQTVQLALAGTVGLTDSQRGVWDMPTRVAWSELQRYTGVTKADGKPDAVTLKHLGERTGLFTTKD